MFTRYICMLNFHINFGIIFNAIKSAIQIGNWILKTVWKTLCAKYDKTDGKILLFIQIKRKKWKRIGNFQKKQNRKYGHCPEHKHLMWVNCLMWGWTWIWHNLHAIYWHFNYNSIFIYTRACRTCVSKENRPNLFWLLFYVEHK